ncbi:unnamed protein product [Haemonchus placei]|uniref:MFS domain-containing protein n=1 Tax=Haemonchus placei TaxID=6290 RepID=A0A0N4VW45_HAEPC|nr:unnamed protein product [Haemonchus placei]
MGKFIVGPISDRATCVSDKWRLVLFATSSYGVMGLSFLSLVFVKTPALAQTAYTLAIVASGWNAVGTLKGAQMVARQHVHIVMAVTSFLLCVTVLLIPVAVNAVCPDNTPEQVSVFANE